jgi:hypothetical protein
MASKLLEQWFGMGLTSSCIFGACVLNLQCLAVAWYGTCFVNSREFIVVGLSVPAVSPRRTQACGSLGGESVEWPGGDGMHPSSARSRWAQKNKVPFRISEAYWLPSALSIVLVWLW